MPEFAHPFGQRGEVCRPNAATYVLSGPVLLGFILGEDVVAQAYALVADVDLRACDELLGILLRLAAERAIPHALLALLDHDSFSYLPEHARSSASWLAV